MEASSKNSTIVIKVNGEDKSIEENTTILSLLESLKISPNKVVAELNKEIIKKESFDSTFLKNLDQLEIVTFVGGG